MTGCASTPEIGADDLTGLSLINPQLPETNVMSGGQPSEQDLELLRDRGVTTVVTLRREDEEVPYDEAAKAAELGMSFVRIPVGTSEGLDAATANKLRQTLAAAPGPTFVHCGSGNRVGALFAIDAMVNDGKSLEEALEVGRAAGLTRFEPRVREVLTELAQ